MKKYCVLFVLCFSFFSSLVFSQSVLQKTGGATRMIVDGKPFLCLGGELGNSSASSVRDINAIFPRLRMMGLNTILVPAYWECIEPEQGKFDFTLVDEVIRQGENNNLKVIFLWFGVWKNSMSCYAPVWFKENYKKYPRSVMDNGQQTEIASAFSENVLQADLSAFTRFMEHIKEVDKNNTVIMVQIENEIGMIGAARDRSDIATKKFEADVPQELIRYMQKNKKNLHPHLLGKWESQGFRTKGNWETVFGADLYTDELFMAWSFAVFVERLAVVAKTIHPIPLFVNAALDTRNRKPGEYPSAGPLAQLKDIWFCGAPHIDFLAPDFYDKDFLGWIHKYKLKDNPMFIPEIRLNDCDGVRAFYAFGEMDALAFSPFSIEDYPITKGDNSNWKAVKLENYTQDDYNDFMNSGSSNLSPIVDAYRVLGQLAPYITEKRGTDDMRGWLLDGNNQQTCLEMGDYRLTVKHSHTLGWGDGYNPDPTRWDEAGGIAIRLSKDEFLFSGTGFVIEFAPKGGKEWKKGDKVIGIAQCREVEIRDGEIETLRYLSGDQTHQGRHIRVVNGPFYTLYVKVYEY